jgi:hypothetical protein
MIYMMRKTKTLLTYFTSISTILFLLISLMPTSSAGIFDIYNCYSVIRIEYDNQIANDPFLPIDMVKEIPLTVNYHVDGYFEDYVPEAYEMESLIYFDIVSKPKWCNVSLMPNFLKLFPKAEGVTRDILLIIKVDENAHAQSSGIVQIKTTVDNMGAVKGGTFFSNISFIPGFYPLIKLNIEEDIKSINPLDIADFKINIENLGNAKTIISSKVLTEYDDWTVSISNETVIGSKTIGDDPQKEIKLSIKPPNNFGYHNERKVIQISMTPKYFNDESITGEEYILSFIVQSRGFSTPGFESILFFLIIIAFIFIIKFKQKTKSIVNFNNKEGKKH